MLKIECKEPFLMHHRPIPRVYIRLILNKESFLNQKALMPPSASLLMQCLGLLSVGQIVLSSGSHMGAFLLQQISVSYR